MGKEDFSPNPGACTNFQIKPRPFLWIEDMKKTSPWFMLLFPIAIPAMMVLDYFGYRIIALIILVALVFSFIYYVYSIFTKFRSLRGEFASLATALYDPASWSLRHFPYHHTLSGDVAGRRLHYSLLGHDERALSQLFLEVPSKRDLSVEASEDQREIPAELAPIRSLKGFRSLKVLSRKVPFFSRFLSGLAGSGGPGLVLRKQVDDPFSLPALKRDLELLLRLAASLDGEPRPGKDER
jgi:hypothetical protein